MASKALPGFESPASANALPDYLNRVKSLLPGLALCLAVTSAAIAGARIEASLVGQAWVEPLILAIPFGAAIRSCIVEATGLSGTKMEMEMLHTTTAIQKLRRHLRESVGRAGSSTGAFNLFLEALGVKCLVRFPNDRS